MKYCSSVAILAQPKAYKIIVNYIKKLKQKKDGQPLYLPYRIAKCKSYLGEFYYISWENVLWYKNFSFVRSIENALAKIKKNNRDEDGYGFKQVIIREDHNIKENFNTIDFYQYLYPVSTFEMDIGDYDFEYLNEGEII